jgi:shikimate kinase
MELRRVEENVISSINLCNHVVATGGSAVYSAKAMEHLGKEGLIIFLEVSFNEILRRISNFKTRGIARRPDQSFEDLFEERLQLYKKYAHKTIFSDGKTQDMVVKEILTVL